MRKKIDLETTSSEHAGLTGLFEKTLRKFKTFMHITTMTPLYFLGCLLMGLCLTPGIWSFRAISQLVETQPAWVQNFSYGFAIATAYFLYGVSLIFLAPLTNKILVGKLKEWRGPYYSIESIKWFIHNGLTYVVRFTFLEFATPSPLNILFYKMMGMKIGKGVTINSTWISDPSLIELSDKVTIGGSVTMVAHYGQGGLLVIAPIKIGAGCTIGLKATIMGDVVIGDGAKILPHSVLLPKTIVPAGETWGGVPAQKVELKKIYSANSIKSAS